MFIPSVTRTGTSVVLDDGLQITRHCFDTQNDASLAEKIWKKELLHCNFTKFSPKR